MKVFYPSQSIEKNKRKSCKQQNLTPKQNHNTTSHTTQHSTTQHNTTQHNTTQHNTHQTTKHQPDTYPPKQYLREREKYLPCNCPSDSNCSSSSAKRLRSTSNRIPSNSSSASLPSLSPASVSDFLPFGTPESSSERYSTDFKLCARHKQTTNQSVQIKHKVSFLRTANSPTRRRSLPAVLFRSNSSSRAASPHWHLSLPPTCAASRATAATVDRQRERRAPHAPACHGAVRDQTAAHRCRTR